MKNIYLTLILTLFVSSAIAQESISSKPVHAIGINAGFSTGVGPTYRYWKNSNGFQITALPIKTSSSWDDLAGIRTVYSMYLPNYDDSSSTFISLGAALFRTIKQHNWYKVFAYAGNHLLITDKNDLYNVGAGLGLTFEFPVSFNLMFGYQANDLLNEYKLLPTAELGVFYKFKQK